MIRIALEYIARHDGDREEAAAEFARALMKGDPQQFKAGYSADNAAITTCEAFELDVDEREDLCSRLGADAELVERCLQ